MMPWDDVWLELMARGLAALMVLVMLATVVISILRSPSISQ